MKRAKRPGRRITPWWDSGPGYLLFMHPSAEQELRLGEGDEYNGEPLLKGEIVAIRVWDVSWSQRRQS